MGIVSVAVPDAGMLTVRVPSRAAATKSRRPPVSSDTTTDTTSAVIGAGVAVSVKTAASPSVTSDASAETVTTSGVCAAARSAGSSAKTSRIGHALRTHHTNARSGAGDIDGTKPAP